MLGLEILTPNGFKPFKGVAKWSHESSIRVTFSDGQSVVCANEHKFIVDEVEIFAKNLVGGERIGNAFVISIESLRGQIDLFDPLSVAGGEIYCHDEGKISHNSFLGSSNTLISAEALMAMQSVPPLEKHGDVKIFARPKEDHDYVTLVDTCKARGMDYSTFTILDVSSRPYEQVATYRNNLISPQIFPDVIYKYSKAYNTAYIIIESNDQGATVFNILRHQFEYERMFIGKVRSGATEGLEMTAKVKRMGCSNLKDLVERGNILLKDDVTIHELKTFEAKGSSFEAAAGSNDDTVMPLVMFAWFTESSAFEEITDTNLRKMMSEDAKRIVQESVPFVGLPSNEAGYRSTAVTFGNDQAGFQHFMKDPDLGMIVEVHEGMDLFGNPYTI